MPHTPFFIVGVHRSGTTLLRFMLNCHPNIYIPPESDFIPRFFLRRPNAELSDSEIARILDTIFTDYRFVKEWRGDRPDPLNYRPQKPCEFLSSVYSLYAQQNAARRWGDKTPIYVSYIPLLIEIFPDAKFIHIIRDGRDVALSILEKWGKSDFHVDLYYAARNWDRRLTEASNATQRLSSSQFLEIRYEDLVTDPPSNLRRVCHFLGEEYVDAMSEPHKLAKNRIPVGGFHAPIREPPSARRIARWKRDMSAEDIRLFQSLAGKTLNRFDYETADAGPMMISDRLRSKALATKYATLQFGRGVLQKLGVLPPI